MSYTSIVHADAVIDVVIVYKNEFWKRHHHPFFFDPNLYIAIRYAVVQIGNQQFAACIDSIPS